VFEAMHSLWPHRAVIEAAATYRCLYDLLRSFGALVLADSLYLWAMVKHRRKTDEFDRRLLAKLLRINQISRAYIPPDNYEQLRDVRRCWVRLARQAAANKAQLLSLLARHNPVAAYQSVYCVRGRPWIDNKTRRHRQFGK
jgi:hypothetical protein